jgi:hypothetical protein
MIRPLLWLVLLVTLVLPGSASAWQGKGKGAGRGAETQRGADRRPPARVESQRGPSASVNRSEQRFRRQERSTIARYVKGISPGQLPPGLAKRGGDLPPGLEKQLRRNGVLPPGLQQHVEGLPAHLERDLPVLAPPLRRGFVAGKVIIYDSSDWVVHDVYDPFR